MQDPIFIEACRNICQKLGTTKPTRRFDEGKEYVDVLIRIECDTRSQGLEITRLSTNNPVIMVDESGKQYRTHGEVRHLHDHVKHLLHIHGL